MAGLPKRSAGSASFVKTPDHERAESHRQGYRRARVDEQPDPIEMAYVWMFAGEVSDFLVANHQVTE
jgi:hypothetical protein